MADSSAASVHSQVLKYLGGFKLPEAGEEVVVDWNDSPLALVKDKLLPRHDFCPCECLASHEGLDLEIQHHDGLLGHKNGTVGAAFANALVNQSDGYNNMQALVAPNLPPPVRTMIITKVGTTSLSRVLQLWGAAQEGLARAVVDAWDNGWFPKGYNDSHVIVTGIFIHPFAGLETPGKDGKYDKKKFLTTDAMERSMHGIYGLTYLAGLGMLSDALTGGLTVEERVAQAKTTTHPYRGFKKKVAAA